MKEPRLWILVALLAILGTILLGRFDRRAFPAEKNSERLEVRRGEAMADLAAKRLGDRKQVVLVTYTPDGDLHTGQDEKAFVERAAKRRLTLLKTIYLDAATRDLEGMQIQRLSAAALRKNISELPKVDAIVSLCGEPRGSLSELKSLPSFFCICDQGGRIPELMKAEIVEAAYVPRQSVPTKDSNDWFKLLYELALPEDVAALSTK